jgi:hypothetical protein
MFEQTTAATACIAGTCTWLPVVQGYLQVFATAIAIIAGALAIYSHFHNKRSK